MNTLFIVNNPDKVTSCMNQMQESDALLLIEDAVYTTEYKISFSGNLMVLEEDLIARGLDLAIHSWKTINYSEFVKQVLNYDKSVSWL